MKDFINIKEIIQILPYVIIYVAPGYIILSIKNYIVGISKKNNYFIIQCIVVSYILINIENFLFFKNGKIDITSLKLIITSIILSLIIGYLVGLIIQSEKFYKILNKANIRHTLQPNFLCDIVDFEKGCWITAYNLSEQLIYQGKMRRFEDNNNDEHFLIMISNYTIYDYDINIVQDNNDDNFNFLIIDLKKCSRFEMTYEKDSKKLFIEKDS